MKLQNETNTNRVGKGGRLILLSIAAAFTFFGCVAVFVDANGSTAGPVANEPGTSAIETAQQKEPAIRPRAGHSDYLRGLTRKAIREGFDKDDVSLLAPQRGPGRDAVAKKMLALASARDNRFGRRMSVAGLKPARPDNTHTAYVGANSYMKVSDDGTKMLFRGNIDDAAEIKRARASGRMLEKDELERLGRRFIKDALSDFVRIGNEESITFLGVKYLRDGNFDDKGRGDEEVVANIAIFGREVRGVPVIGGGSKIAIWFANDRQPVGFDVDWPVYDVIRTEQKVLSRSRLNERVRATTVPIDGTARAEVARFECGYVDLGSSKRSAQIQSGCAIHYASRYDDGTLSARIEYVPAAERVIADPKWPLSRLIAGGRTISTNSAEYVRYASSKAPPREDVSRDR